MHIPLRPPCSLSLQTKQLDPFCEPQPSVWKSPPVLVGMGRGHPAQMEDSEEHIDPRTQE